MRAPSKLYGNMGWTRPQQRLGLRVKSSLFGYDFDVFHWAFVGQVFQSKAETFLFSFLESFQPIQPFFELQAKTCCNVLDTDDEDADWLLGGAKAEPINWRCRIFFSKSQTKTPHRHRVKSVGLGTKMVFPGMDLAVSVQAWENPPGL